MYTNKAQPTDHYLIIP